MFKFTENQTVPIILKQLQSHKNSQEVVGVLKKFSQEKCFIGALITLKCPNFFNFENQQKI